MDSRKHVQQVSAYTYYSFAAVVIVSVTLQYIAQAASILVFRNKVYHSPRLTDQESRCCIDHSQHIVVIIVASVKMKTSLK